MLQIGLCSLAVTLQSLYRRFFRLWMRETENYNFLGVQKWKEQKLVTYVLFMPLTA